MLSASLVTLALLQAAVPQSLRTTQALTADVIGGMLGQFGPVVASGSAPARDPRVMLRFGPTDAWGCVRSASTASYCRHVGVATDGQAPLVVAGAPIVATAGGYAYGPCRWAVLGGTGNSLCWSPLGLDPVAYTSWLQAQQRTGEENSMVSVGELRGRQLAAEKARAGTQQSQVIPPGIHPRSPQPQTAAGGYSRPAERSSVAKPSSSRSGGRELP